MSRTYSSCRPSHFFSRYVIGSKITRRMSKFLSLRSVVFLHSSRHLLVLSSFLAHFHFLLCLSFTRTFIAIVHTAWSFEIVVSNYDISTRYLYIYIPVGSSLAYTILPFRRIHSFVEGGEGISFVYDYKAFYFITTLPKAFPQGPRCARTFAIWEKFISSLTSFSITCISPDTFIANNVVSTIFRD